MNVKNRSRLFVFILSLFVWIALTDITNAQEIIAGIAVAFLVSLLAGDMLITTEKSEHVFRRLISAVIYLITFLWEMIKANLHVAYIVIHPKLPIKPGIVKIKTQLTKDSSLTLLTNSITLTPGTLTIDINKENKDIYVHWIDTKTTDIKEATETIGGRFEHRLKEVFE